MVSQASKLRWGKMAFGLALVPALAVANIAPAQTGPSSSSIAAVRESDASATGKTSADAEEVRKLVKQGRDALKAGDKAKAEHLAKQAQALKVPSQAWWDDTPEKLLADCGVKPLAAKPAANVDRYTLVKQGRAALERGKLDEAKTLAQQANVMGGKWGLFEDSPAKLLDDVQKAKSKADKEESARVLAEGRKLYEQHKLDDAEKLAYKAERLHGPYSMWDLGDRPAKLVADIQQAKDKDRKVKLPPVPGKPTDSATAKAPTKPTTDSGVTTAKMSPAPAWPGDKETKPAEGGVMTASATMPAAMPNPAKGQAMGLMAQGKSLMVSGRFVEARVKFMEAQKLKVEFGADEETPQKCLMDLSAAVTRHIDTVVQAAASCSPADHAKCEGHLVQARSLAVSFGLDAGVVDMKLVAMKQPSEATAQAMPKPAEMPGMTAQAAPAPAAPMAQAAPTSMTGLQNQQGLVILEKARLELRRGQCELARQLAAEAFNGPYGVQDDASAVLRSIDVEEHNQRVLAANRNFDAGMSAYQAKDMAQSLAIFRQVDAGMLTPEKRVQMKDALVALQQSAPAPAMAPMTASAMYVPAMPRTEVVQVGNPVMPPNGAIQQASMTESTSGTATGETLAQQVMALQKIEVQRQREEGMKALKDAKVMFDRGETEAAMDTLEGYRTRLKASKLDPADIVMLDRPIEHREQMFKMLRAQKDFEKNVVGKKAHVEGEIAKEVLAEQKKHEQVKELMKQYSSLVKEGKYSEALVAAEKAHELDPDDPSTEAAVSIAKLQSAQWDYAKIKDGKESMFLKGMNDTEKEGPYVNSDHPLEIDPATLRTAQRRPKVDGVNLKTYSEMERKIQSKLTTSIDVNFKNVPLRQAIDDLRVMTGINIVPEMGALESDGYNLDKTVTLKMDQASLKSVLKLMLDQCHLTYTVGDDALKITTERQARGSLARKVYSVADLVIPVDDYALPTNSNLMRAMDRTIEQTKLNLGNGSGPFANGRNMLPGGDAVGGSGNAAMNTLGSASLSTQGSPNSAISYTGNVTPQKQVMQDTLIKLITNTISPQSWAEVGGSGTIDYMPMGMALVINQTPDVQEQVAELLDALRRLQDLEVSVEVRILTLAETFFERIGLDFNLNVKTNKINAQYEPQLTTGQFQPGGQVNDFSPGRALIGLTPAGNFTSNLDVPIQSSSFQYAIPPFAYPNNPGSNGGLSLGLAFLSDIQVYMFMEAAQGDRRTNVMQAPKLTLFNGQTSTINVNDQQFFVTNVSVVGFGGQIVFVPQNNPFPLGVQLTIQAVVSADRRFVRLNLTPTLSNIASATVPLFPVTTFITPVFEGGGQGQPIPFTQYIQQPQISIVQIQTTVSIPDGGTVILGGLKTLSEGRNEYGPPVLSKLPYVNRLFKNVGYGREAQSLLLMVTPRIIINSEEEEKQTGINGASSPQVQ